MDSPAFSSFREDIVKWDEAAKKEKEQLINALVDSPSFAFFFKKDKGLFAADEMNRVVFARMKDPDDENHTVDELFSAYDLIKVMLGERLQNTFKSDDLDEIQVVDKDEAVKWLVQHSNKVPDALSALKSMMVKVQRA
tara:strand:+ start:557 stop:970 length:414 start_codon:yes stop_codon:yes gene_type:complete